MSGGYKQCTRCVMDTTTALIVFDEKGVCNFCHDYDKHAAESVLRDRAIRYAEFDQLISEIKLQGKGKEYDCILGLSGGVDSSYLALIAHDQGLRPLVVHFDNGWDNELAVKNIQNIIQKLNYDMSTYVVDWNEFKDLQLAYFKASVIDLEVPTDQLIVATLYKLAKEHGIKSILNGNNFRTEYILPRDWIYSKKLDLVNLTNIHKKFGKIPLKNFPKIGINDRYRYQKVDGIRMATFFDKIDFNLNEVKERLIKELNWTPYPGKHYESIFTRFYQGYILLKKFNVDKRKAHLSSLICSGQITRAEALNELKLPPYPTELQMEDRNYVIKKWGLTEVEFDRIMAEKKVPHESYGEEKGANLMNRLREEVKLIYRYQILKRLGLFK
ncbi:MAG: N-acetyl sugar amidotransferase [Sphingobacteriaceae bacterium]|nr:N-acetyl sugar amidotransferase [Sphingobacteriaceae bacterium]